MKACANNRSESFLRVRPLRIAHRPSVSLCAPRPPLQSYHWICSQLAKIPRRALSLPIQRFNISTIQRFGRGFTAPRSTALMSLRRQSLVPRSLQVLPITNSNLQSSRAKHSRAMEKHTQSTKKHIGLYLLANRNVQIKVQLNAANVYAKNALKLLICQHLDNFPFTCAEKKVQITLGWVTVGGSYANLLLFIYSRPFVSICDVLSTVPSRESHASKMLTFTLL